MTPTPRALAALNAQPMGQAERNAVIKLASQLACDDGYCDEIYEEHVSQAMRCVLGAKAEIEAAQ